MLILFDHGTPAPLASSLTGHTVKKTKDLGWDTLNNGELLRVAEQAAFEVFLTTDKNIRYQQNLTGRSIAIVLITKQQWPELRNHTSLVDSAISSAQPGSYSEVDIP